VVVKTAIDGIAEFFWSKTMQLTRNSLSLRSDTMFGVCEALGQTFGISANWFRVAFAAAVIYNLELAAIAYLGIGVLVLIAHLVYPSRAVAPAETAPTSVQADDTVAVKAPAKAPVFAEAA
jgi:phage shock protein PspC (stress-responsive transcriptional regulator)